MDVISEIKNFEQLPERSNFSSDRIKGFYDTLTGREMTIQAIISAVKKGTSSDYEIYADTYRYTVMHNPVSGGSYVSWIPDLSFVCEGTQDNFKFNPITDLIKGDRCHCTASYIAHEGKTNRIRLITFEKIRFLEIEEEKNLLQKKFDSNLKEMNVYAPQRQYQKRALGKTINAFIIGAIIGGAAGAMIGGLGALFDPEAPILMPTIEYAFIGAIVLGFLGMVRGLLMPALRK
jgi:hypothetical protein